MTITSNFAPNEDLAQKLLPFVFGVTDDASHDLSHILRVWGNVQVLTAQEGGDTVILTAATLLHDCVDVPKDSPLRSSASRMAADKATEVLTRMNWNQKEIKMVAHAIESHSFSARVAPLSLEAKILQDADRLDAMGHIGIARCFYVSGRLGRAIYDPDDPDALDRELDDTSFAIDHFHSKLLQLAGSFQTKTGNKLGAERHETTRKFLDGLLREVSPTPGAKGAHP